MTLSRGDRYLDVAMEAARVGGDICKEYFNQKIGFQNKAVSNLVTEADLHSEKAIVEVIRKEFPDHAILAEENQKGDVDSECLWVVDPLDGTNNFAHQIPHFAVSIGFWKKGKPHCGVIWNPVRDDLYCAKKNEGAYWGSQRLGVSRIATLSEALVGCGFYYDRGEMMRATLRAVEACFAKNIHGIRRFGTASLDLIQVASGRYGGFFEYRLAPWDFAAGRLFVEEAGGKVTTCKGDELTLKESTVLASNGHVHDELLDITRQYHP
ncbi:MAG: inositol monophosphatase family protein [Planctomycetota bacterium]|nr:inositol monophosphatase family protein [Planctomycetota bacterium]